MTEIYKSEAGASLIQARYSEILRELPFEHQEMFLPTTFGETFVLACGPPDAPPVVLLHGSGGNSATWWYELRAWSKEFRVYAVDMIGEPGLSVRSRCALDSEQHAQWLDQVFDGLRLTAASVVGMSLGGWLALDYATRRPHRVRRLALLCPGGLGRQRRAMLWLAIPLMFMGAWGRRKSMDLLAGRFAAPEPDGPDLAAFTALTFRHFNPRMESLPRFGPERLTQLTMPTLLIVGGRDAMFDSKESCQRLEAHAPYLTIRFIHDAPHALTGEAEPVAAFLRQERPR